MAILLHQRLPGYSVPSAGTAAYDKRFGELHLRREARPDTAETQGRQINGRRPHILVGRGGHAEEQQPKHTAGGQTISQHAEPS